MSYRLTGSYSHSHVAKLRAERDELLAACREFVRKCECGEARSKRSYAQMKEAIANATSKDNTKEQG